MNVTSSFFWDTVTLPQAIMLLAAAVFLHGWLTQSVWGVWSMHKAAHAALLEFTAWCKRQNGTP